LALALSLAASADPSQQLKELDRLWEHGSGSKAWQQLEQLEKLPQKDWPRQLRRRFYLRRADMLAHALPELAIANWTEALRYSKSKEEQCEILCAQLELASESGSFSPKMYGQALRDFQQSGANNRTLEARLALLSGLAKVSSANPGEDIALEFMHAARLFESQQNWDKAVQSWLALFRLQGELQHPDFQVHSLAQAERCAAKAGKGHNRGWLQLASLTDSGQYFRASQSGDPAPQGNAKLYFWKSKMWDSSTPAERAEMMTYLARSGEPKYWPEADRQAQASQDVDLQLWVLNRSWFSRNKTPAEAKKLIQRAVELCQSGDKPSPLKWVGRNPLDWQVRLANYLQSQGVGEEAYALRNQVPQELTSVSEFNGANALLAIELSSYHIKQSLELAQRIRNQLLRLHTPRERVQVFTGYLQAMERSSQTRDGAASGELLASDTLAGRLQRATLNDVSFVETILADLDRVLESTGRLTFVNRVSFGTSKAGLLAKLGRLVEAIEQMQKLALEAGEGPLSVSIQRELARLYRRAGRPQAAVDALTRAESLAQRNNQSTQVIAVLEELSRVHRSLKNYRLAVETAQKAASLVTSRSRQSMSIATALGRAYWESGNPKEAAQVFAKAKKEYRNPEQKMELQAMEAWTLYEVGQAPEAAQLMEEVVSFQLTAGDWGPLIGNALGLANWYSRGGQPQRAIQLLTPMANRLLELRVESPEAVPRMNDVLEKLAGQLLEQGKPEEAQRWLQALQTLQVVAEQPGLRSDPRVAKLEESRGDLARLKETLRGTPDAATRTALEQKLSEERLRFAGLLEDLRARYPEYDRLSSLRATEVPRIQANLPEDVLLLQLFPTAEGVHSLEITKDRRTSHFTPIDRKTLSRAVRGYLTDLSKGQSSSPSKWGPQLAQWLIEPILDDCIGKHLVLLPSGELSGVPLDSLPTSSGLLSESTVVSHALPGDLSVQSAPKAEVQMLALGAPLGVDLPGTALELKAIQTIFPATAWTGLLGAEASYAQLSAQCANRDIIHLATHAEVNAERPADSYLQLSDRRVGVAEILGLPLRPGSLVFLSACSTGQADAHQSSDLNSLANAFRAAGAGTVIYSLWPIDDDASAELATAFYRSLKSGTTAAKALQLAKQHLRVQPKYADPFYWAGFQILGGSNGY
jgi:CHAT domain-containing protein